MTNKIREILTELVTQMRIGNKLTMTIPQAETALKAHFKSLVTSEVKLHEIFYKSADMEISLSIARGLKAIRDDIERKIGEER